MGVYFSSCPTWHQPSLIRIKESQYFFSSGALSRYRGQGGRLFYIKKIYMVIGLFSGSMVSKCVYSSSTSTRVGIEFGLCSSGCDSPSLSFFPSSVSLLATLRPFPFFSPTLHTQRSLQAFNVSQNRLAGPLLPRSLGPFAHDQLQARFSQPALAADARAPLGSCRLRPGGASRLRPHLA